MPPRSHIIVRKYIFKTQGQPLTSKTQGQPLTRKTQGQPLTRCASTEDRQRCNSSTFAKGVGGQLHASAALALERTDRPSAGSRVGLVAYLDGMERVFSLIFVVPCIMLNSEIIPTRCNNCVYSSQWLYSTCFG